MTDETAKQAQQTVLSERLAVLKKNKAFIVGASILGFWVFSAIFGKFIARYDQDFMDYEYINGACQLPEDGRVISRRLTVGHQRNGTVSAMGGGGLTARNILRRTRPWLTEVRMEVYERWENETLRILRPWFSSLDKCAARLSHPIAPFKSRHLPAMHFDRGNASTSALRIHNPVVLQ